MISFDKENQRRIFRIADNRAQGKPVPEEDQRIVHVMNAHPEFDETWKQGELAAYPQEINGQVVNPFVHTVLHVIIDRQIFNEDPECVAETHNRLVQQGLDEHESLHAIISVFADIYFRTFRNGGQFDPLEYQSRLSLLSYEENVENED